MIGHPTESIHRRHAIVDEAMLRERALKLARDHDTAHERAVGTAKVVRIGRKSEGSR